MTRKQTTFNSLEDTEKFAKEFACDLVEKKTHILFFEGEMGAGKTTFIKAMGEALGIKEKITSPTFVGINEYYSGGMNFIHIDAYQNKIDFDYLMEIISDPTSKIICIEWSENLPDDFRKKIINDESIIKFNMKMESIANNEDCRVLNVAKL